MSKEEKTTAYKGFDKELKCRDFQYEVGKEYEQQGNVELCERGYHACENPFDVLSYYDGVLDNRYCEVEQLGQIKKDAKKSVPSKIVIKAEIGWVGLFKAGVEYIKEITDPKKIKPTNICLKDNGNDGAQIGSSGDYAQIGSSGFDAQIGSSGNDAQIGSSGDYAKIGSSGFDAQIGSSGNGAKIGSSGFDAQIDSTGNDSVICCAGHNSIVKAKVGSWITLAEWEYSEDKKHWIPKCVKTEYVDGERIKSGVWYELKDGEFREVE